VKGIRQLFELDCLTEWSVLGSILRKDWIERVWVLQEVAFAKGATFYCGKSAILLAELVDVMLWSIYSFPSPYFSAEMNQRQATKIAYFMFASRNNFRQMIQDRVSPRPFVPLYDVLRHTATSKAAMACDKIIAI
jgi:hypothetical protein